MIIAATADRRGYGSPVIRNTYQTVVTRRDLYHQHHVETIGPKSFILGSMDAVLLC